MKYLALYYKTNPLFCNKKTLNRKSKVLDISNFVLTDLIIGEEKIIVTRLNKKVRFCNIVKQLVIYGG